MLAVSHSVEFICNINLREEYIKLKDKKTKDKISETQNKQRKHRPTQWPKEKGQNDKQ